MLRAGVVAVVILPLLLPGAAAQFLPPEVRLRAEPNLDRVPPETGFAAIPVRAEVACNGAEAGGFTSVSYGGSFPRYATVRFNPATDRRAATPEECAPRHSQVFTTNMTVVFSREAPAFADVPFKITVNVTKDGAKAEKYGPFEAPFSLKPGYFPFTQVRPLALYQQAPAGRAVRFPVEITNLGNGPTTVTLSFAAEGQSPLRDLPGEPALRLQSIPTDGPESYHRATVSIDARAPDAPGIYLFRAIFNSTFAGTGESSTAWLSRSTDVVFSLEVLGFFAPGPDVAVMAAALVGALAFARRRR